MPEDQIAISSGGCELYGMLHRPSGSSRGGIVFANPIFEEHKSSQRVMVNMARILCDNGFTVLRFDYRGCGDSPGSQKDFSIPDWLADIRSAIEFVQGTVPGPIGLLGLRIGASLALAASVEVVYRVLWEPVISGSDFIEQELRRKLMKEMMTFGKSRTSRAELIAELKSGRTIDLAGYPLTPSLYHDICNMDLLKHADTNSSCLLVNITHRQKETKEMTQLHDAKPSLELKVVTEQPFWNLIGLADRPGLLDVTGKWIDGKTGIIRE